MTKRLIKADFNQNAEQMNDLELTEEIQEEDKTYLIPMSEFIEHCMNEDLINYDGIGFYATETMRTEKEIFPNDVADYGSYDERYSHVLWFPR